jgi:phenylpropionate dioxygenase-like ring-hydroxylating dioxygenase large terminal subunit
VNSDESGLADVLRALREQPDRCLPQGAYRDPAFFELERECVLRPGWHPIARSDQLPQVGDYLSFELFGEPLVLVRDDAQRLRAFSRVCLHRAHPIVSGAGNTKRWVCPYHLWSYDLSGRLQGAPMMGDAFDRERRTHRLPEASLEEWQGFVFVSLDSNAAPIAPHLTALAELFEPWGFADLRYATTLDFDSPWNWKVMVENFMESVHHAGPHKSTLQRSNPAQGTHVVELEGDFALLENPGVGGAAPFWVAHVFPTLLFSLLRGDEPFATWYEMQFSGPDHLQLRIHLMLPEETASNPNLVEAYRVALDQIHREDIPVCEGVQKGLQSSLWNPGFLGPREGALQQFHHYLARRVAGTR